MLAAPQIDEHVFAVEVAVFLDQVVGVEPDQTRRHRYLALPAFHPGAIAVVALADPDHCAGRINVLVPQAQSLADPYPSAGQQLDQKSVP